MPRYGWVIAVLVGLPVLPPMAVAPVLGAFPMPDGVWTEFRRQREDNR